MKMIVDWCKENWGTLSMLLVLAASFVGLKLEFRKGPPGTNPAIIIVIPEGGSPKAVGAPVTNEQVLSALKRAEESITKETK